MRSGRKTWWLEDTYVWADTTDGVISLRSDAPPAPWLQIDCLGGNVLITALRTPAQANTYIVLRIGNSEEVNQFRIEITKGSNTFYYSRRGVQADSQVRDQPQILRPPELEPPIRR